MKGVKTRKIFAVSFFLLGVVFFIYYLSIPKIQLSPGQETFFDIKNLMFILSLVFVVVGVGVLMNGGLEEKLFFKDKKNVIRINDFLGELVKEGIPTGFLDDAESSLRLMLKKFGKNPEEKKEFQEVVLVDYIKSARYQRDYTDDWPIEPNTERSMADRFLREWDPNYRAVKHPLLREREYAEHLNPLQTNYDTREVTDVMKANIPGFKVELLTNHDVKVSYMGEKFTIFGGSTVDYETSSNQIDNVIRRIAENDIKREEIEKKDLRERKEVLKKTIFGD
ncbi:MAG: hypothetical protein ABIG37_02325 [Nanoarchaeota archaeon]